VGRPRQVHGGTRLLASHRLRFDQHGRRRPRGDEHLPAPGGFGEIHEPARVPVFPRHPLPLDSLRNDVAAEVPPLIKGYLRAGAWICGEPAWDPDFNTADLPVLLPMARLDKRYAKHFLERQ
jgi:hypothetical protein